MVFFFIAPAQGRSALAALGSCVIPSLYYAWVQQHTLNATRLLLHGVLRMVLTATFMALSIVVVGIEPAGFFVTFAVMQFAYLAK